MGVEILSHVANAMNPDGGYDEKRGYRARVEDYWRQVDNWQDDLETRLSWAGESSPEDLIDSDTFTPLGKRLGMGCYGVVDLYTDSSGQRWAIKIFKPSERAQKKMKEFGWTEDDVMRNEAIPLDAAHHNIVPRLIERDKKGRMFVAMPVYSGGTLDRKIINQGYLSFPEEDGKAIQARYKESLSIARDIASALSYFHSTHVGAGNKAKVRVHADLKPDNILIKDKRAFVGDLGSSTCISIDADEGKTRGSHANENYRAPECFTERGAPSPRGDVFSFGAVLYTMLTGRGIYSGIASPKELSEKEFDSEIRERVKAAPRKLRGFLRRCLAHNPEKRYADGNVVLEELEKATARFNSWYAMKQLGKLAAIIALPVASIVAGSYGYHTYEPQKLDMPKTYLVRGIIYKPVKGDVIEFDAEEMNDLPAVRPLGIYTEEIIRSAKNATDNRIVAYLVKTHLQAELATGGRIYDYSEREFRNYLAHTSPEEREAIMMRNPNQGAPIVGRAIEAALQHGKNGNGRYDLEDVMAVTRIGAEKVEEAKRACRSLDYRVYRSAKDATGKLIISEKERNFIDHWISYFHADRG